MGPGSGPMGPPSWPDGAPVLAHRLEGGHRVGSVWAPFCISSRRAIFRC